MIDIGTDPRAREISEREYEDFVNKLKSIIKLYNDYRDEFIKVMMNAKKSFSREPP